MKYIRDEYPRPQLRRDDWQPLNGEWDFTFDDRDEGLFRGYERGEGSFGRKIAVPFSYQYAASGIGERENHEIFWYRRTFTIGKERGDKGKLLCFNGVDYACSVWVNGIFVGAHQGGYLPFQLDVTVAAKTGENVVAVRCVDPFTPDTPRGKQSWTGERYGCWYIANSGIWQSVWLEYYKEDYIAEFLLTPDIDALSFGGEIATGRAKATAARVDVSYRGQIVKTATFTLDGRHTRYTVNLMETNYVDEDCFWSPERPNLFYVDLTLYRDGKEADRLHTRFGFRKIAVDEHGTICLNNAPFYQRLVLDQGYWAESGLTPPTADALRKDIELSIAMGFNGARKHQKIEDPYYYYFAEELGFVVWCEMPSAYNFHAEEMCALTAEWQQTVRLMRNFTAVVAYVPMNESWGVRKVYANGAQQNFVRALYYFTKAMDSTRLVGSNDGWEAVCPTDFLGIHDYAYSSEDFGAKYTAETYDGIYPQNRKLFARGNVYEGQPVLLTEFGGVAMSDAVQNGGWGYNSGAQNDAEFYERYKALLNGVYAHLGMQGFCYTQLTDVQQEVNGLLRADHTPKFSTEEIKKYTKR